MGFLLQMAGFPGTGKSTLSNRISQQIGAVVIDRDIIKNSMMDSGIEGEVLAKASYKVVYDLASHLLSIGDNVIIDTPCFYKEGVDTGLAIANKNCVDYRYIECIVDDYSIIENRLSNRARLVTQIEGTTEEVYFRCYDQSVKPDNVAHLTLDTSNIEGIDFEVIKAYLSDK